MILKTIQNDDYNYSAFREIDDPVACHVEKVN